MERSSGILLHISSLPSGYGVGNLGGAARAFVDFLHAAGQRWWQILPVGPTGYGDSPYQSPSSYAGNPYFIDPEGLMEAGWLRREDVQRIDWGADASQTDYSLLYRERPKLLKQAFAAFRQQIPADYRDFCERNDAWLSEHALFMALKAHFSGAPWSCWPQALRLHRADACARYAAELHEEMEYERFIQYVFDAQWRALHDYARAKNVKILGDLPIYVPYDSVDVWANPEMFQLTRTRRLRAVAGCPPDGFSRTGQYWGNPLYDWEYMARDSYAWWLRRAGAAAARFDAVRIDHFRGISSYWSIPAQNRTARCGCWVKGPGMALIDALKASFPQTQFVAEDLGFLTPAVRRLVRDSGFPGMKVLEFAFDPSEKSDYLPRRFGEMCICYTGTHDNQTLSQFCGEMSPASRSYARRYLRLKPSDDLADGILDAGMQSKAGLFIAQMQDYLRLGAAARMNEPGVMNERNWRWRLVPGQLTAPLATRIADLTSRAGRV